MSTPKTNAIRITAFAALVAVSAALCDLRHYLVARMAFDPQGASAFVEKAQRATALDIARINACQSLVVAKIGRAADARLRYCLSKNLNDMETVVGIVGFSPQILQWLELHPADQEMRIYALAAVQRGKDDFTRERIVVDQTVMLAQARQTSVIARTVSRPYAVEPIPHDKAKALHNVELALAASERNARAKGIGFM